MSKYYNYYRKYPDGSIKSIRDVAQIIGLFCLLYVFKYIPPIYLFIRENFLYILFITFILILLVGVVLWYFHRRSIIKDQKIKELHYQSMQKFEDIMKLNWREFEEFIAEILKQKGFDTILGLGRRDGGIDITAKLGDKKFYVQCKHYGYDNIGVEKIRELNGVMNGEIVPAGGIFVTTTGFTSDAVSEAMKYGIELWDKNYIVSFLQTSKINSKKTSIQDNSNRFCEKCGGKLILRTAHNGPNTGMKFFGCENFPECHFTKNI